jgi:hypothetical protein
MNAITQELHEVCERFAESDRTHLDACQAYARINVVTQKYGDNEWMSIPQELRQVVVSIMALVMTGVQPSARS